MEEPYKKAIKECIEKGILADYLMRKISLNVDLASSLILKEIVDMYNSNSDLFEYKELNPGAVTYYDGCVDVYKRQELKVKVINIRPEEHHEILEKCQVLKEYSQFMEIVQNYPVSYTHLFRRMLHERLRSIRL